MRDLLIAQFMFRTTVCPEEYINMKIEPGKESHWRIAYDFYVLPQAR